MSQIHQKQVADKIDGYKKFWTRNAVKRPLIGFDVSGYFPFQRFKALREIGDNVILQPELLKPEAYLDDYTEFYKDSARVDDDLIKGVSPIPAIPWMEAMLGCPVEISGESIWGRERNASWDELEDLNLEDDNSWFTKYLEFLAALGSNSNGEYPVSQPILRGISDLIGALRGNNQALIDTMDEPERVMQLARRCADALLKVTERQYEIIEPFYGGYLIEQFAIWAPDKIVRLQEDVSAVYSPKTYCELIQERDRFLAAAFPCSLIHLHNSSLFLLDYFLEIEEIDIFQINRDAVGMSTEEMIPYLQKVQEKKRCLLIRGSLTRADLQLIKDDLSPNGLLLQIVVNSVNEAENYTDFLETVF